MANGIDWFRWHHGSVKDPKFALIARKASARLGDVIAVWAYLLEKASASTERGHYGSIDAEAVDCMLGMDDGTTAAILTAMDARGLTCGQSILNWERRQPKRERPDDSSADRVRAHRERNNANGNPVTPCNASDNQETPRGEESREEERTSKAQETTSPSPSAGADEPPADKFPPCPQQKIRDLYREILPTAIQPKTWDASDAAALSARWRATFERLKFAEEQQGLDWFRTLFEAVGQSDFLMGRSQSVAKQPFRLRLQWITKRENFKKITEGFYQ